MRQIARRTNSYTYVSRSTNAPQFGSRQATFAYPNAILLDEVRAGESRDDPMEVELATTW